MRWTPKPPGAGTRPMFPCRNALCSEGWHYTLGCPNVGRTSTTPRRMPAGADEQAAEHWHLERQRQQAEREAADRAARTVWVPLPGDAPAPADPPRLLWLLVTAPVALALLAVMLLLLLHP